MRGNPIIRASSTHPYHRSGPITDDPHPGFTGVEAERRSQTDAGEQEPQPIPSAPAALEAPLADELSDLLWRRQESGLDQLLPSARQRSSAQNSGMWWDQRLAEIEDLATELKRKVAQYALFRAIHSPDQTAALENEAAVAWMHENLEDIAATALGMEMASREVFLRAGSALDQDLKFETAREQKTGTAE